jgi:hypothetical protein
VPLFLIGGVLFLDMGGIEKDYLGDIGGSRSTVYPALKTLADQLGEQAGMVQMSVGQQDGVKVFR